VEYDDGDPDVDLCRSCVRRFVEYSVGEDVEYREVGDDTYYPGSIVKAHPDDTCDVRLESGELVKNVGSSALRRTVLPSPDQFRVGSPVLGLFGGEGEDWFPGKIVRDYGDGTFAVEYDDGDYDPKLPGTFLQPRS